MSVIDTLKETRKEAESRIKALRKEQDLHLNAAQRVRENLNNEVGELARVNTALSALGSK